MSFGLQCSSQKANDSFYSAILEHKSNAAKRGTVDLSCVFKWSKKFWLTIQFSSKVCPSVYLSIKDVQSFGSVISRNSIFCCEAMLPSCVFCS